MSKIKKEEATNDITEKKIQDNKYSKKELLKVAQYANRKDILNVLLKEEGSYSFKEVDELLKNFLERKVN